MGGATSTGGVSTTGSDTIILEACSGKLAPISGNAAEAGVSGATSLTMGGTAGGSLAGC